MITPEREAEGGAQEGACGRRGQAVLVLRLVLQRVGGDGGRICGAERRTVGAQVGALKAVASICVAICVAVVTRADEAHADQRTAQSCVVVHVAGFAHPAASPIRDTHQYVKWRERVSTGAVHLQVIHRRQQSNLCRDGSLQIVLVHLAAKEPQAVVSK